MVAYFSVCSACMHDEGGYCEMQFKCGDISDATVVQMVLDEPTTFMEMLFK